MQPNCSPEFHLYPILHWHLLLVLQRSSYSFLTILPNTNSFIGYWRRVVLSWYDYTFLGVCEGLHIEDLLRVSCCTRLTITKRWASKLGFICLVLFGRLTYPQSLWWWRFIVRINSWLHEFLIFFFFCVSHGCISLSSLDSSINLFQELLSMPKQDLYVNSCVLPFKVILTALPPSQHQHMHGTWHTWSLHFKTAMAIGYRLCPSWRIIGKHCNMWRKSGRK